MFRYKNNKNIILIYFQIKHFKNNYYYNKKVSFIYYLQYFLKKYIKIVFFIFKKFIFNSKNI